MKPLAEFADSHPLSAGATGISCGICAKLLAALHLIAGPAADVGAIASAGVSVLMLAALVANLRRKWIAARAEAAFVERYQRQLADDDFPTHGSE